MADIRRVLKSKELQRKIKENMYKTVIKPVAIYGSKLYQLNTKKGNVISPRKKSTTDSIWMEEMDQINGEGNK